MNWNKKEKFPKYIFKNSIDNTSNYSVKNVLNKMILLEKNFRIWELMEWFLEEENEIKKIKRKLNFVNQYFKFSKRRK